MSESRLWRSLLSVAAVIGVIVFFAQVWGILIPFILGVALAYLVSPVVGRFVSAGWRRDRVVLILYITLLVSTIAVAVWILPRLWVEIHHIAAEMPAYAAAFDGLVGRLNAFLQEALGRFFGEKAVLFKIPFNAERLTENVLTRLSGNVMTYAHFGLWIFIVPFVAFFALSQGREWIDKLFDVTPSAYVESLLGLFAEANAALGGYIRGALLESLCVATMTMVGLACLGFDGAILLGVVTGLLNPVPFLAPVVGGGLALFIGYFQGLPIAALWGIFMLFVVVRLIDDFLIIPFVIGHHVQLHPIVMLFAVLSGYEVAGFLGLVFAVPGAAIIKVALSVILARRRDVPLIGASQVLS